MNSELIKEVAIELCFMEGCDPMQKCHRVTYPDGPHGEVPLYELYLERAERYIEACERATRILEARHSK